MVVGRIFLLINHVLNRFYLNQCKFIHHVTPSGFGISIVIVFYNHITHSGLIGFLRF
jgi:hypothetical protein